MKDLDEEGRQARCYRLNLAPVAEVQWERGIYYVELR